MLVKHQASLDDKKRFTALVKDLFPDQAKNVNLLLMAYNMGIAQDIQAVSYINNTFALVKDLFPDQAKNVNLLLMAYNMGIAQDIQAVSYINNTFAFRYVKQLMDDFGLFPDQAKNVNLLLMAYNMGIAQDIQAVSYINNTFAFRYVKQLMDDFGMSRVNADWIVSVWCSCYGGKVLGKACDISVQKQGKGPAIQGETTSSGKVYGDLFTYEKGRHGKGLAVTGFRGDKNRTIIFQNKAGNTSVVEIADDSFSNSQTEEAILTEGISYIGNRAFSGCKNLHQVVLPMSMEEIGGFAFENCSSLKSISLPMALKAVGDASYGIKGCWRWDI